MYWCLHCSVILYKMLILDVSCRRHITQEFKQMRGWSTCCPPFKTVCFFSSWACSLTQYFDIKPFSCTKASTEPEDLHRLRSGDLVVYGNKLNLLPFSPVEWKWGLCFKVSNVTEVRNVVCVFSSRRKPKRKEQLTNRSVLKVLKLNICNLHFEENVSFVLFMWTFFLPFTVCVIVTGHE